MNEQDPRIKDEVEETKIAEGSEDASPRLAPGKRIFFGGQWGYFDKMGNFHPETKVGGK